MAKKSSMNPGFGMAKTAVAQPAKPVTPVAVPAPSKTTSSAPVITQEMISKRAHEVWVAQGRPVGKDKEHWAQAERELRAGKK